MKTITKGVFRNTIPIVAAVAALLTTTPNAPAIEGLTLSLQCSNVVLSWPCLDDGSETFIVQYRQTLNTNTPWQTLEPYLYSVWGTNMMYYIHSNIVQYPNCGGSGGSSLMAMSLAAGLSGADTIAIAPPPMPMAMRADGSSDAVPVAIYPPGFDFSNFIISDPSTGEWVSGAGVTREAVMLAASPSFGTMDGPVPLDGGSGGGGTNTPPETGFYRVVRVGPHMVGITNSMILSGVWRIPVEVGGPDHSQLVTLTLTESDSPVGEDSIHVSPFELPVPLVTLDTTRMSNGVHQISAMAQWTLADGSSYDVACQPICITVSNEVFFPNWMPYFGEGGNTLLISAQSAHTDTDWWIDIYGANAGYIGTFAGHTYDGNIYGWWDLVGPGGTQYTNEPWFQFEVSTWYADPPTPKSYRIADPWPGFGEWTIVAQHAWDNLLGSEELYAELNGFIGMAQGVGWAVRPTPQDGNAFGLHFQDSNEASDWASFRQALFHPNCRNLIYFGHGGPNGLGYNQRSTNSSICVPEIAARLATIPAGLTNRHAFRLVIADGCSTAKGKLPEAFGIIHKEGVPSIDYANASMRMSAFVGWSSDKWIGTMGSVNFDHVNFIIYMQQEMALSGATISLAAYNAAHKPNIGYINTSELKIFGCGDVTFGSQNR